MNPDLRLRLNHYPSKKAERFFDALTDAMWKKCRRPKGSTGVITVGEVKGNDDTGYVVYDYRLNRFYITIDIRLDFGSRCDYLVHEMAHVDCWTRTENKEEDHCMVWGAAYAKMYRLYLQLYEEFWG